jgi:hypothetical protein
MKPPVPEMVFAKCKRGTDAATKGQSSCGSLSAHRLSREGAPTVMFRCAKCNFVWAVPVGGSVNI